MRLKKKIKVAIDSPAAAGAGTQAKMISKHYNLFQLDTGRCYRFIAHIKLTEPSRYSYSFIKKRIDKLWVHCKNIGAITLFQSNDRLKDCHYFWHQKDDIALTSRNILWTYPDKVLSKNSICVMPELSNQEIPDFVYGICSDHIMDYTIYNVF